MSSLRFYDSEELEVDLELAGSTSSVLCPKTAESPFSSARGLREELARTQPGVCLKRACGLSGATAGKCQGNNL